MQGLMGVGVQDGGAVFALSVQTLTLDPPLIGAVAAADVAANLPGVAVGDFVIPIAPATFTAGLAIHGYTVTGVGTGNLRLTNASAAGIDGAALVWSFLIFDRTQLA